ncbi:MAG: 50S ribosomal protein L25/general stress protein Ctc [Candidatus Cloacimonetes bacterium]|nr:50S ribosomal protein L25/general stress protein Ctc [Candidatus Cloacimonadota bacterium]
MVAQPKLKAEKRESMGKGTARKLRATGRIPAVLYGRGEESRPLSVDAHELELLMQRVHLESTIVQLQIDGERRAVKALAREVQRHPYRPSVLHVDFIQIHAGDKVTVEVPIRLVGQAPGVRAGGLMQHALTELEVRCLPDDIPEFIEVNIEGMEIGDSKHVRDAQLPEGVEATQDPDRTICSVIPPQAGIAEPSAEETAEAEGGEPEVIKRAKEEGAES